MRRCALLLSLLVSLALVATQAQAVPGELAAAQRKATAPATTFNTPRPWGSQAAQYSIVNRVVKAINGVNGPTTKYPNPTITVSSYLLDHTRSVTALIEACKRGVGVRVILDRDIDNRNSRRLISALNGDNIKKKSDRPRTRKCGLPRTKARASKSTLARETGTVMMTRKQATASLNMPTGASYTWGKDKSYVKKCSGSCRNAGDGGNMHTKMYLFSRTNATNHVVMVSSSNLNRGGAQNGWNDLYVMRNRPKSYTFYLKVHRAMTKQVRASTLPLEIKDGPYLSRFFPMRGAGKKQDPTLKDLNTVKCSSAFGRTEIYVSMFYWAGKRGDYIADKLLALAKNGCKVSIVYGAPSRLIAARLRAAAGSGRINLYDSRWDFNDDDYNEVRTHAKFVAIRGTYRGKNNAYVVMTGSQNWVGGSLTLSDESTLNVNLKSAYKAYRARWEIIKNHSRRLPYA